MPVPGPVTLSEVWSPLFCPHNMVSFKSRMGLVLEAPVVLCGPKRQDILMSRWGKATDVPLGGRDNFVSLFPFSPGPGSWVVFAQRWPLARAVCQVWLSF